MSDIPRTNFAGAGTNRQERDQTQLGGVERQDLGKVFDFKLSNSLKHAF